MKNNKDVNVHHSSPITHHSSVVYHHGTVAYEHRCKLLNQHGAVLWFTGLSGSGKSTIAVGLEKKLTEMGKLCYRLDGDNLRHGLNSDLGFSKEEREENIRRVAEVAALFKDAGVITLVSFIAPYKKMREFARKVCGEQFYEIYVKASVGVCKSRDPKGLYKKAEAGEISDFTGISAPYEEPENPDLILDTASVSVKEAVEKVLEEVLK